MARARNDETDMGTEIEAFALLLKQTETILTKSTLTATITLDGKALYGAGTGEDDKKDDLVEERADLHEHYLEPIIGQTVCSCDLDSIVNWAERMNSTLGDFSARVSEALNACASTIKGIIQVIGSRSVSEGPLDSASSEQQAGNSIG